MYKFWSRYSYDVVKVMLFHLVVGGFGVTLNAFEAIMFKVSTENPNGESMGAKIAFLVGVVLIYMFLLYGEMWKLGAKEATVERGPLKYAGLYIGLMGSILDILIAIYMVLATFVKSLPSVLSSIFMGVDLVYNGMYLNLLKMVVGTNVDEAGKSVNLLLGSEFPWIYFVTFIPTMISCVLGYALGRRELHLTKLFIHETPEEKEVKAEEKRNRSGKND